jgi:GTPase
VQEEVTGNTSGLKTSELKALERLYRRRVAPTEIVSPELASQLGAIAADLHRQVGVLIDRRGAIAHVMVGDASKIVLPDLGRLRGGAGRLRGVRLVHTHLRGEPLTRDDLTDLGLLRLDAVAALTIDASGQPNKLFVACMQPDAEPLVLPAEPALASKLDFLDLIAGIETRFARAHRVAATDAGKDRAIVVYVTTTNTRDSEARIDELRELCRTAGVKVLDVIEQRRQDPDPKYLVGRGKLQDILLRAMQLGAECVIFDPDLSPGQARAISEATELKVLDRTMLILDIFAQHATSRDGKLQVELAQLRYALPRLVEKNTMMSRLTGGIGGRGPGETKLEINRRRARERIHLLEKRLTELAEDRRLRRKQRGRREVPVIAICGYTNAGKSTLLNALTEADARAENKLFATLDPLSRRLRFPEPPEHEVVITDTVGFIRDLPRELIAAFSATLEEMSEAELLVQVIDAADDDRDQQIEAVDAILADLGLAEKPRLRVWNKADRLDERDADHLERSRDGFLVSALDRSTLGPLLLAIERALWRTGNAAQVLPVARG